MAEPSSMRSAWGSKKRGSWIIEGRNYTGLVRHLILALVVLGFVTTHTERLRGGKSDGDDGAGVPGAEPAVPGAVPTARDLRGAAHQ